MSFAGTTNLSEIPDQYDQIPVAELIETFDWSSTPLGPMDSWEPTLKSTVVVIIINFNYFWKDSFSKLSVLFIF